MKIVQLFVFIFLFYGCTNYSQVTFVTKLPKKLKEASGLVKSTDSTFWMHNDGGNKNRLYLINTSGEIIKTVEIKAKNRDWEDITSDNKGNIYLADFGNNRSARKDLVILKIKESDLLSKKSVKVEKIKFSYPEQNKFPPKKKKLFFDAESIFYLKENLYIFTKSRVKHNYGKTSLYRIPAKKGTFEAEYISSFENCSNINCWITSAAISKDKTKVALLTSQEVLLFSDFKNDDFFTGNLKRIDLGFSSQKEAIDFVGDSLYISDERSHGSGGNLYRISIPKD
ncbi:hypothetical protein BTO06_00820 [Tenacibaculum sp. SZ-18]|uniref:hypothetical protein n=1 Tax=Tenacibaculum sp. SZ-18 TaxID=754423 RepID=UPI000C2D58CD|nr:hypothetical protein [Tenacibaculum sp. SZ-18]AUC13777.1 hypothetical protein BTO06_00820 [Tenacibaculum sp. SZ-18]